MDIDSRYLELIDFYQDRQEEEVDWSNYLGKDYLSKFDPSSPRGNLLMISADDYYTIITNNGYSKKYNDWNEFENYTSSRIFDYILITKEDKIITADPIVIISFLDQFNFLSSKHTRCYFCGLPATFADGTVIFNIENKRYSKETVRLCSICYMIEQDDAKVTLHDSDPIEVRFHHMAGDRWIFQSEDIFSLTPEKAVEASIGDQPRHDENHFVIENDGKVSLQGKKPQSTTQQGDLNDFF